jgi:glutamate synthase (ferredoxin)
VGNVSCYGATSGELYVRGLAGERFCVRNSGVRAVVEGVGDHGCEYMTGGLVVVLGPVGYNFAAGMSGGVAYVYDRDGDFAAHCNTDMVRLFPVNGDDERRELRELIEKHVRYTGSTVGRRILDDWDREIVKFVQVFPNDYREMLSEIRKAEAEGLEGDRRLTVAFERKVACGHRE